MKYHLSRNGKPLGIFSLEEIQRLQDTGQLDGSEFVWREGMANWQPAATVLKTTTEKFIETEGGYSNRTRSIVLSLAACVLIASVGAIIWFAWNGTKRLSSIQRTLSSSGLAAPRTAAWEAASKPVIMGTNSATEAEAWKREWAFRDRQFVEDYQERGERNPQSDDRALRLIKLWADKLVDSDDTDTNLPAIRALGNELAADSAFTDPLALTITAVTSAELHEGNLRLERAVKGFANSKHRAFPKFFATVHLADKLIDGRETRVPQLDSQSIIYFEQALTDGSLRPEDQAELGEILVNEWGKNFFERNADSVVKLVEKQGKPFEWLALTLRGENEIKKAWAARGGGYRDSVSANGWEGFSDHLAKAREALTQAWQLKPELPLAPCRMIYVSLGDADITEMRLWFDRTVAAQIDYTRAWSDMRWGLRPRWYGDRASMLAFGITALNTHRFDTCVPRVFSEAMEDIRSEYGSQSGGYIYRDTDIWPHLQEMYEGYIAADIDPYTRDDWRTSYAVIAYLTRQYELAAKQLAPMNWQPHAAQLTGWGYDLSLMVDHVRAVTGPLKSELVRAGQATGRSHGTNTDAVIALYDQIATNPQADAATVTYARERAATLKLAEQFRTGNWMNFLPADTNFFGWHVVRGQFTVKPDGSLEVKSDENGHIIYARMPVRTDFEMRGEYVVESSTTKAFQGGLVMGFPEFETYNWYAFRVKRNDFEGDVASFSQHWTTRQITQRIDMNPVTNSFDFKFQNGVVTASVNGHEVFKDASPPANDYVSTNRMWLGLGAFNDSNITTIRYRNVQVRSLSSSDGLDTTP
jgi:hypothetical protein